MEPKQGWITPTRRILSCPGNEHLQFAGQDPELKALVPRYDELVQEVQDAHDSCEELQEREGRTNAEWHTYEIARSDAASELYDTLIKAGCVRFGHGYTNDPCFEGTPEAVKAAHDTIMSLVLDQRPDIRTRIYKTAVQEAEEQAAATARQILENRNLCGVYSP